MGKLNMGIIFGQKIIKMTSFSYFLTLNCHTCAQCDLHRILIWQNQLTKHKADKNGK